MITLSSICYHYLSRNDEFFRIWGHTFELFKKHIDFLNDRYDIIDPKDFLAEKFRDGKNYMLLTFDDGLKEHMHMANYLDSLGLKGIFAVPACILRREPANPQIIHFGMAYYGVRKFYSFVVDKITSQYQQYVNLLVAEPDNIDLMKLHEIVKNIFKRQLDPITGRKILLEIFTDHLKQDFPNFMDLVHLDKEDIIQLVKHGHTLAVHSDTHPVIKDIEHNEELMVNEVVQAKKNLSDLIGQDINIFVHPFGAEADVLKDKDYFIKHGYKAILTTHRTSDIFNLLDLGRYCTFSQDSVNDLEKNLWHYKINL